MRDNAFSEKSLQIHSKLVDAIEGEPKADAHIALMILLGQITSECAGALEPTLAFVKQVHSSQLEVLKKRAANG